MLSALPEGVNSELYLKGHVGPDSGHFKHMMRQLTQGLSTKQTALAQGAMVDAGNHRLVNDMAIQLRESAQRLCAGSFKTRDIAACRTAIGKAVTQLERAIGLGSWSACADLAELLVNSNKVGMGHPDEERAFELVAAHAREDPDCAGVVALCFIYESNVEEAHEFAEHSAAEGSKYGQFALGLLEKRRKNYPAAVAQFQLAAAQNYDEAQLQLGSMCQRGDGVALDFNEAMRLYHLAADQGNRDAFFLLGTMHRDAIRQKISVDPKADLKEAIYWLELAVAADQRKAETVLKNLKRGPDFD
jgi:TPR repeat protein